MLHIAGPTDYEEVRDVYAKVPLLKQHVAATGRIVVQATPQDKKAIADKARRLALPVSVMGATAVAVPATAVFLRGSQHYVFVQSAPGVFEPRDVNVFHEGAKTVLLDQGLKEGETLLVTPRRARVFVQPGAGI